MVHVRNRTYGANTEKGFTEQVPLTALKGSEHCGVEVRLDFLAHLEEEKEIKPTGNLFSRLSTLSNWDKRKGSWRLFTLRSTTY